MRLLVQQTLPSTTTQMKNREESEEGKDGDGDVDGAIAISIWDCGSPLYDSYELVTLTHLIDRHLMALPCLGGSRRLKTHFSSASNLTPPSASSLAASGKAKGSFMVGFGSEFVERKMWKRKMKTGDQERKGRAKNSRNGLFEICHRIGAWRK